MWQRMLRSHFHVGSLIVGFLCGVGAPVRVSGPFGNAEIPSGSPAYQIVYAVPAIVAFVMWVRNGRVVTPEGQENLTASMLLLLGDVLVAYLAFGVGFGLTSLARYWL
jgi:hypothetical protein